MPIAGRARATHTTLECHDVAKSLRFYRDVLGLRVNTLSPLVGHVWDSKGHYAAALQSGQCVQQPLLNFYSRPVPRAADVDRAFQAIVAVRDEHGIREVTEPAREDRNKFGVGSYGFYVNDRDGNWWRIEDNDGPGGAFGPVDLGPVDPGKGALDPAHDAASLSPASIVPPGPIAYVALESRELSASVRFYRDVLGMDVEEPASHYCLCRSDGVVNVVVVEVGDRLVPQKISNHHGLTLEGGHESVDALRAALGECAGAYGIRKVLPATRQHGSYAFYMQDADTNCWEFEVWDDGISPVERALRKDASWLR